MRLEEMNQSMRIIEQAIAKLPKGPICVDDRKVISAPERGGVYDYRRECMNHFKLIYDYIHPPQGEAYAYVEGGKRGARILRGLGRRLQLVNCRVRPPCFPTMAALEGILKGHMIADIVPIDGWST